jgi:uncharacterized protein YndB with AHSA1/START domain
MTSSTSETTLATTQVNVVFIKATPDAIWQAITEPAFNDRYGYFSKSEYELRPGGAYRGFANDAMREHGAPGVIIDGEVLEADPPRRLVQTWHAMFSPEMAAEPPTRLTWEIEPAFGETCKLTVTHETDAAPLTGEMTSGRHADAGGGWAWVLSDLKSLLETGSSIGGM